jgi:hypothetical protein
MKVKCYKNDYRLFFWIASALFLISWIMPPMHKSYSETRLGVLGWLWNYYGEGNTTFSHFLARVFEEILFSLIVSILPAWLIQGVVVMMRGEEPKD